MAYELAKAYVQIIPTTKGIKGQLTGIMDSEADAAGKSAGGKFGASFGSVLKAAGAAIGSALAAGGAALVAFTKSAVEAGMSFDSSMSQVAATMGKTMDELNSDIQTVTINNEKWTGSLRDFAKKMGAETQYSATQAADALNYMALAGYDTKTSMEMLPNVMNLAAAGSMDLARASDMVTDTQSALGLSLEETNAMVDQMAMAASKSNTSVEQLGDAMLKIGATARNVKGGTQELSTVLGVLADNGIKGSEGGTHLRNILLSLQSAAKDGAVDFGDFSVSVYDADGNMRSMIDIVEDMQKGMGDMSQEARDAMISGVFNKTDLASVNALLNTSTERFDELTVAITNSKDAAAQMAETQLDNLAGDITIMQSAFEGLQIAISDGATPALRESVKGITEVINGLNDLVSGVDGGADRIKAGFSQILNGVRTALPALLDMFGAVAGAILEMVPELVSQLVQLLPGLFNTVMNAISALIPGLFKLLPDLVSAFLQMVVMLVGHLSEIITPIIKAIPTIIKGVVSAILDNLPMLLQGVLELIVSIASELPSMTNELIEYIPQLFIQLAVAIVKCIPIILSSIGQLIENIAMSLLGLEDPVKQTGEKLQGLGDAARDGWAEISEVFNQELDMSGLLSSLGHTSSEIQSEIDRLEGEITNIYATRLREQSGLRAEDIEDIKNYQEQIKALEEEKLSIYGSQANAQLEIMRGITNGTAEEYAQRFALLQSADEQERASVEASYQQKYVDAENHHTAMLTAAADYLAQQGGIEDAHYQQMLIDAETAYTDEKAAADTFYTERNQAIADRESEALNIMATANGSFIADTTSTYNQAAAVTADWQAESGELMSQYCTDAQVMQTAAGITFQQLANNLSATDAKNAAAWLSMAAKARSGGANLTGAAKDNAAGILNAFQNVPSDLEDDAHQMIMGMANGLEDEIPALKNSSQMTAEEIANAIADYLQIRSPSRLMQNMGQNTVAGLAQGIKNSGSSAAGAMQSVGSNLVRGVGVGMQSMSGWLYSVAYNTVANAVSAAKRAGDIRSPSHVMRDEVGLMLSEGMALGIEDGQPMILDAVDEIGEGVNSAFSDISIMDGLLEDTVGVPRNVVNDLNLAAGETGRMLSTATADINIGREDDQSEIMQQMLNLQLRYLPEIIRVIAEKKGISAEELAAMLASPMSKELGKLERMNGRGICLA